MSSLSLGMLYEYLFLFVGMTLLYLVGVGYRYKFVVQVVSALLLVLSGSWIDSLGGLFGIYSVSALVGGLRRGLRDERHQPDRRH